MQPQQLEEAIKIPKETIEVLKNQVFGFDTFFITSQDPYEVSSHLRVVVDIISIVVRYSIKMNS